MEAAGNMITKEFDGGGALTRVAGLQQSGDPQHPGHAGGVGERG